MNTFSCFFFKNYISFFFFSPLSDKKQRLDSHIIVAIACKEVKILDDCVDFTELMMFEMWRLIFNSESVDNTLIDILVKEMSLSRSIC